jgi:lysophospholipase L1-like esterase
MRNLILLVMVSLLPGFLAEPPKKITLWLIGDSTMSVKEVKAYPETGWGMPFAHFWDSTIRVDNRAQNGRSTQTFIQEKRWESVINAMKEGDYAFIQFGHNDEVPTKASYTTPVVFAANLKRYIEDTRSKKGIPVLITPVARRKFDAGGQLESTHEAYSAIVRSVANENHTVLIDLDAKSQELLKKWGVEKSTCLFNQLTAGEHPNYPEGKEDNTHFNELGARLMAELALQDIRLQLPALAARIYVPATKK